MIIVDTALKARAAAGNPVRVGMIGAGFMARGIANSIVNSFPGLKLAAISNRRVERALQAFTYAGVTEVREVATLPALADCIARGVAAVTDDPLLLCQAGGIDILVEVTGNVEFGARVALAAIEHGKDLVQMNAELDATLGPVLKARADRRGVVISGCDGDQPGVQINLYRFVKSLGLTPLLCGNIKGLHDPYRNPTTQQGWATRWGMDAAMVTSFADGTKISFEQAIVANATGMCVAKRGMIGGNVEGHVDELTKNYDVDELRRLGGIVDYVVGAKPAPGVFVFGAHDDPKQRHYLHLYKLGEGPLYSFYTPYHLCHLEVPISIARLALFKDPVMQPLAGPRVEVVATAKIDLKAGTTLDGIGEYMTYGQCENYDVARAENLLPMGLAGGCRLLRDIPRDGVITRDAVELPPNRLCDALRAEQDLLFPPALRKEEFSRAELSAAV